MRIVSIFTALLLIIAVSSAHAEETAKMSSPQDLDYVGEMIYHDALHEDTLIDLARRNNLGFVEMRAANPLIDPWLPGEGTDIIIPAQHIFPHAKHEGIIINLPEMRLYLFPADGGTPITYPIGVGRAGLETPEGATQVMRKAIGPIWRPTARMREEDPNLPEYIRPGPKNPLGTHALYLGWPQYAIHGTNKPFGIGRRVSSGCIRLYPEDILKLYDQVNVGNKVQVVNQPVKAGWIDDVFFVEANPTLDQSNDVEENGSSPFLTFSDQDMDIISQAAGEFADQIDWSKIRAAIKDRKGYPVEIFMKPTPEISPAATTAHDHAPQTTDDNT